MKHRNTPSRPTADPQPDPISMVKAEAAKAEAARAEAAKAKAAKAEAARAEASKAEEAKTEEAKGEAAKGGWEFTEIRFGGAYSLSNQPVEETGQGKAAGVAKLKAQPDKYEAVMYQSNVGDRSIYGITI